MAACRPELNPCMKSQYAGDDRAERGWSQRGLPGSAGWCWGQEDNLGHLRHGGVLLRQCAGAWSLLNRGGDLGPEV